MAFARVLKSAGSAVQIYVNRTQHEQLVPFAPWKESYTFTSMERGELADGSVKIQPFDYAAAVLTEPKNQKRQE